MSRVSLLQSIAALGIGILLAQISALATELYWQVWWLDIVMHFLGGIWIALLLLWFFFYSGYMNMPRTRSIPALFLGAVFSVLLVGVLWEWYEWSWGTTFNIEGYWLDTIGDIASDIAGGLAGCLFFVKYFWTNDV